MNKQILIDALTGDHNKGFKEVMIDMIKVGDVSIKENGKIYLYANLRESQKGIAYALANWDQYATCSALITHDLHSFECHDVGSFITKLRLE